MKDRRMLSPAVLALAAGLAFSGCSAGGSHASPALPETQGATRMAKSGVGNLPHYNLKLTNITSAGVSSGGAMATQFHYAHSANVKYEAQVAGVPYFCSQGNLVGADNCMLGIFAENLPGLEAEAVSFGNAGEIDSTSNLKGSKGYFYSGLLDYVVAHQSVRNSEAELQHFGGTTIDNYTTASGHGWISPNGPLPCPVTITPYILTCGIDPEQTFLSYFYGALNPKSTNPQGSLIQFNQNTYAPGGNALAINLDNTGWIFVPQSCANGTACNLVVVFTGCLASQIEIGTLLMTDGNVDNWADTNNLVVLYPQLSVGFGSCWDFYGYTGPNFAFQSGPQIQAVWNMVQAL
ncbi:MAG: hypothetical protein WCE44_04985 [Candidatus Velthaea sp.]